MARAPSLAVTPDMPNAAPSRARLAAQFMSFLGVGAIGFTVDALILFALTGGYAHWHPYAARAGSSVCAISATWALNRHITFRERKSRAVRSEYVRYVLTQAFGLGVNVGVFMAAVAMAPVFRQKPLLALALGSAAALLVNFLTARRIAFDARVSSSTPRS
ncbi:MAG TPA: GtrA family protein [Steroidobacteraceae bacterium]|nr:GtrA family protein [Steroidobacteraceae bacterium]